MTKRKNKKMDIVVLGSINTDRVINTNRMPQIGETISGSGFSINCGGKGANQAIAVAKLGGNVTFIGAFCMNMKGNIEDAVGFATAASAITVGRAGASKSIPTREEVEKFIEDMSKR